MTLIYVYLKPFVAEFITHAFGNPVRFPRSSIENSTIVHFTQPLPSDRQPETPHNMPRRSGYTLTPIVVPDSKTKPAERYFYLAPRGKAAVEEACEFLFTRCLWQELYDLADVGCTLMTAIYAWAELHGVNPEHAYTIRQRYYRLRDSYQKRGIGTLFRHRNRN